MAEQDSPIQTSSKGKASYALDRLSRHLKEAFSSHIDMSDWTNSRKPDSDKEIAFLSRALAALVIAHLANTDPMTAGDAVVDEGTDNGIDAIYHDSISGILYAVQSKWKQSGEGSFQIEHTQRFAQGIRDLLVPRFEKFGAKLRKKEAVIRRVLWDPNTQFVAITAHTGSQAIGPQSSQPIDDWKASMNDDVKQADVKHLKFSDVWEILTSASSPKSIGLTVFLREWGKLRTPYEAYYGRVRASEIAEWWRKEERNLCSRNLRHFNPSTGVNGAIGKTLKEDPKLFWYFNNGITIVCKSVKAALAGGDTKRIGCFQCENVSIVNGAQTFGMIGTESQPAPDPTGDDSDIDDNTPWVQIRIITTSSDDGSFERRITRATNYQNAVEARDFASLDPVQHRLAVEFSIDRRRYTFKTGEDDATGEDGCSLYEATQALGCASENPDVAVLIKREIGLVWQDTENPPYTDLFNAAITAPVIWNAVQIMRAVDKELHRLSQNGIPRADFIGIHLNRLVLHMVFRDPRLKSFRDHSSNTETLRKIATKDCTPVFSAIGKYLEENHPNDYLASFAKNRTKCRSLVEKSVWDPPPIEPATTKIPRPVIKESLFEEESQ